MERGTHLDHYKIGDKIGEGGMGAVYRAEDTRLKREVAVKVLPPEVSADAEMLARLQREAQLLASLNHPNVATVHGFGEADVDDGEGTRHVAFLVMELVDGESLHDRVSGGPLPWREAVQVASGIAAGLEAAHEKGIVHRDLKPANVHLATDGTVKVLDFGLAKAYGGDGASTSLELSASPTVAAATRTGIILGTAAYMSPEQARGKAVDKRADIWALGCVLYEMLAGHKAFLGETVSDILAAILKEHPDFDALPPLPQRLRVLLERMLQKDPKLRLRDVGDARLELEASHEESAHTPAGAASGLSWRTAVTAGLVVLLAGLAFGWLGRGTPAQPPERHVMLAPDSISAGSDALAVSPDGTLVAEMGFGTGIRVRATDDLSWRDLADTGGNWSLSFDASGERIYFARGNEVLSVAPDGGTPVVQATFETGAWVYALYRGQDGTIQASVWDSGPSRIFRILPNGGTEELWSGEIAGSRLIAYGELAPGRWIGYASTVAGSLGLVVVKDGEADPPMMLAGYRDPTHLGKGELLAVDERGRLASLRVDPSTGDVIDQPVVRLEGLALNSGRATYDIGANGTLIYVAGSVADSGETLVWVDRDGNETAATSRVGTHDIDSRLSPDGQLLALEVQGADDAPVSVWIHDMERDVRAALTPGVSSAFPVWSPDSREIVLHLAEGIEPAGIYRMPADRSAEPQLLLAEEEGAVPLPMDWSPDGQTLLYVRSPNFTRTADPANGLWLLPLGGGEPEVFLDTSASEVDARFSPDGRWIAYGSDQSGQREIYVRPTGGGGEIQVSATGGRDPEWSPAGDELFFLRGRAVLSAEFDGTAARPVGAERLVVQLDNRSRRNLLIVGRDGRFLASMFGGDAQSAAVHALFNWRHLTDRQ